ncbi:MAG TPA: OmpA family protein, partial [Polyangiaceae bacterium]|nr:OmpA family protein [Polyangiaceae bacterium]
IPSGNSSEYLGDNSFHAVLPRALVAGQIGWFEYAAHLGFHYRGLDTTIAGASVGSDVLFGASAGVRALDGKLVAGPELYGSTGVTGSVFATQTTPVELLLGGHYLIGSSVRVGAGIAPGLTRAYGEPSVRYLASVEWVSSPAAPPPPDRDHDGILDADDACPDEKGIADPDPKKNGCPPPKDTDGDGIFDPVDACPNEKGVPDPDPQKNGCPKSVRVSETEIVILEQVQFDTGKAVIKKASDALLDEVAEVLKEHPEITKLEVQGHTDDRGRRANNEVLSQARAKAVMTALVNRGLDAERLTAKGYGQNRPLVPNTTEEGRQKNRRVQFVIVSKQPKETH